MVNPCGLHSPPLAALIARASETDVSLTPGRRLAHLRNTPPLGAGILYLAFGQPNASICSLKQWFTLDQLAES
jgi:hypothetical protein